MVCSAAPVAGGAMPAPETPLHKGRHRFRSVLSSRACPGGLAFPACAVCALRWLPQRNHVYRFLREAPALYLQAVFDSREYRCFVIARLAWLEPQQQLAAALGARMLREKNEDCLRSLCRR